MTAPIRERNVDVAMQSDSRVFLDACVLANYAVCDLLLRLAERPRQYLPMWSEEVLSETRRTLERLKWPVHLIDSFDAAIRNAFPEALVTGYNHLLSRVTNEKKDRHVLAAAIHGDCETILTFNLRDFAQDTLSPWEIEAKHPQEYLNTLYEMDRAQVIARIVEITAKRDERIEDTLMRLGVSLPTFSRHIFDDLNLR